MRLQSFVVTGIVYMMTTGCVKEIPLNSHGSPLYVIEGRISDLWGPYYVRITKSADPVSGAATSNDVEAVTGARVIISDDDAGITDTLAPSPDRINRYTYSFRNRNIDSVFGNYADPDHIAAHGYYETSKISGIPGHTYHLKVQINDSVFEASAYMPAVPKLDSIAFRDTTIAPYVNSGYVPVVWFKEPQNEKNYYLLSYNYPDYYRYDYFLNWRSYSYTALPFYVLDDKILPPDINSLFVQVTTISHNRNSQYYPYLYPGSNTTPTQVKLCSLTKNAYDYYDALNRQLQNDGNIYQPVPSSAAGNISGGALGLFWATSVSYKLAYF